MEESMTVRNVFEILIFVLFLLEEPRENIDKNIPFLLFFNSLGFFFFPWLRLWDTMTKSPKQTVSILIHSDVLLALAAPCFLGSFTTLFVLHLPISTDAEDMKS